MYGLIKSNNLETFVSSAMNFPDISDVQLKAAYNNYNKTNDKSVLQLVILSHLKLVVAYAFKVDKQRKMLGDLIQAGCVGLLKASTNYEVSTNIPFSAYARFHIRREMFDHLITYTTFFKIATTKPELKVFFSYAKIQKCLTNKESLSEEDLELLSSDLEVPKATITIMVNKMKARFVDDIYEMETNEPISINSSPLELIEYEEYETTLDYIRENIYFLNDDRLVDIIKGRYFSEKQIPFKHFAEKYGISIERVSQLEKQAINKLRTLFTPKEVD